MTGSPRHCFFVLLFALLSSQVSYGQIAARDEGLLSLSLHTTEHPPLIGAWNGGLRQTYSTGNEQTEATFHETTVWIGREFRDLFAVRILANYKAASSTNFYGTSWLTSPALNSQLWLSPGDHSFDPVSNSGVGDGRIEITKYLGRWQRSAIHAGFSHPLSKMKPGPTMLLQSTVGIPSALIGFSFDDISWHIPPKNALPSLEEGFQFKMRYGATLGYQHFFGSNTIGFDRGDDIALTMRAQTASWPIQLGVDMSGIYHFSDIDTLNDPTYTSQQPKGVTINGGVSLTYNANQGRFYSQRYYSVDSPEFAISLFASTPLYARTTKGYNYRSFVAGLTFSLGTY